MLHEIEGSDSGCSLQVWDWEGECFEQRVQRKWQEMTH